MVDADRIRAPLLLIHSEQDHRCPLEQAEQLYRRLKGQKRPVELVLFPEENHDLSRGGRPFRNKQCVAIVGGLGTAALMSSTTLA